jgi:DNA-binding transcriptional regulator LsrR (DeoR family)
MIGLTMEIDARSNHRPGIEYVRQIMEATGLRQQDIADRLDLSRVAIGNYYSGRKKMPYPVQVCIELMSGAGEYPPSDHRYAVNRSN